MTRVSAPILLVVCLFSAVVAAQDVISVIKPTRSGGANGTLGVPLNGRFTAANVTAADVIAAAYGGLLPLNREHILGLPPWAFAERFDVEARAAGAERLDDVGDDATITAAFEMVRTMLADRFALKVHDASRQEPVYALVRAARGSRNLKPTTRDCDAIAKAGPFAAPPAGVDPATWQPCSVRVRRGEIAAAGGTLAQLALRLSAVNGIERPVLDRTGLTGRFDFTLQWTPPQPAAPGVDGVAAAADTGPSLFTALQEQLGLRLESTRGPVRILVIDRIARPTPN